MQKLYGETYQDYLKKLFLTISMPSYPLPPNPKEGCLMFDDYRRMWIVFNGKQWVDVDLQEHKCNLNEKSVQE